jgi:hypothetical protein
MSLRGERSSPLRAGARRDRPGGPSYLREAAAASFCWAFFCLRGKRDLPLLASLGILIFLGGVAGLATTAAGAGTSLSSFFFFFSAMKILVVYAAVWRVAARPQLCGNYLTLLGWSRTGWRKVPVEVVLNLDFLAGQNHPSPPDIAGADIIFADNVGVRCQDRNRPIRFISQTVVQLVNGLGTLHPLSIA